MKRCDLHIKYTRAKVKRFADHQCIFACYWAGFHLNCAGYPIGYCAIEQVKLVTHLLYKQVNSTHFVKAR